MRLQRTLRAPVEFEGVALHSGERVQARCLPAALNTGVEFLRVDLPEARPIPAHISYLSTKERRTRLERGEAQVDTVEHLLAACAGLGLDNLTVELSGQEMPGMDGSSLPFVELFKKAGLVEQRGEARVLVLDEPVFVRSGETSLVALPSEKPGLSLQYTANYDGAGLPPESYSLDLTPESFETEIAPARTFCLAAEAEALLAAGLGKGATPENTVVLGDPDSKLRMAGEPTRHKLLDLIGDLRLLGMDLQAQVLANRSGHALNAELVRLLLDRAQELEGGGIAERESGMDVREVMQMLPHRYPFLLIDRVIEIDGFKRAVAIKNVSINEPYFGGHFPDQPLMPGVLQLEAMAQLAGVLILRKMENTGKLAVLWAIDKVKLRGPVVPGDQLRLEVETLRMKAQIGQVKGTATVAGKPVSEAVLTFTMVDA